MKQTSEGPAPGALRPLCIVLVAGVLALVSSLPSVASTRQQVVAAMSATYVHGVDAALAAAVVGPEDVPVLLELLADRTFPRRDNVVAFLAHRGGAEAAAGLVAFLSQRVDKTIPEEDRAALLAPQALGLIAARNEPTALSALLDMTAADAGRRYRALSRRDRLRAALLGLARSRRTEARARMQALASAPETARAAETAAELMAHLDGGAGSSADPSAPVPQVQDTQTQTHDSGLTFANHVDVTLPMTNARLDEVLAASTIAFGRVDYPDDVSCCTIFHRTGTAASFGTAGDGLDMVDTDTVQDAVFADTAGRVKVVREISFCGGLVSMNIIGCAENPGDSMIVERLSSVPLEATLWMHEYGHNVGLAHVVDTRNVMAPSLASTGQGLITQTQCDAYHNPPVAAAQTPVNVGSCADADADGVHDGSAACGDGTTDPNEECDDGNNTDGDCCSSECYFEYFNSCADDSDTCTADYCGGAGGSCVHTPNGSCPACQNVVAIPAQGGTFAFQTTGTSTQTPSACDTSVSGSAPEVVLAWTPTATGTALVNYCDADFDALLSTRRDDCTTGQQLFCTDICFIAMNVTAGTTYFLSVDGNNGTSGGFTIVVDPPAVCGDGTQSFGEECDDGNVIPDDGCTDQCTICGNDIVSPPEECDDGNLDDGDECSSECRLVCPPSPLNGCRLPAPEKGSIKLQDKFPDDKDSLAWSWAKGAITPKDDYGDPTTTDAYQFCLYDGGGLRSSNTIQPGGTCGARPCWSEKDTSFTYKNKTLAPNGISQLSLKEGLVPEKASIKLKGKKGLLEIPNDLSNLSSPVRGQIRRPGGPCWETVFTAPFKLQTSEKFQDKSD
ncbi:MAG TPA: DUF4215 domain-containing protein [Candidatus Binatia bacterium]|nr:DUF4215 domain-containing protein [Candidatus Binatia bacterium]